MSKLVQLSEKQINFIGSGQIVQNLMSFIKEILENSLDANSSQIKVQINLNAQTIHKISIEDNGIGIDGKDFPNLCRRYFTSKISNYQEMLKTNFLGFWGEALNAISFNSNLTVISNNNASNNQANSAIFMNGEIIKKNNQDIQLVARERGTTMILENIYYNHLKKRSQLKDLGNLKSIEHLIKSYAVQFFDVLFIFKINSKIIYQSDPSLSWADQLKKGFGIIKNSELIETNETLENSLLTFKAFFTKPNDCLKNKTFIIFVNNRLVKLPSLEEQLKEVYSNITMSVNKCASSFFVFMEIQTHSGIIDFNVSTSKEEIKLVKERNIIKFICECVKDKLRENVNIKSFKVSKVEFNYFPDKNENQKQSKSKISIRNNPKEMKLEYFSQSQFGIKKKEFQISLDQANKKVQTNYDNQSSCEILVNSQFVGVVDAFYVLLQYQDQLLEFFSFNFLQTMFSQMLSNFEAYQLYFENYEQNLLSLNLNQIKQNFSILLQNSNFEISQIEKKLQNFDFQISHNLIQINKQTITIKVHQQLISLINQNSINYLLLQILLQNNNINPIKLSIQFHLYLLHNQKIFEQNNQHKIGEFYQTLLIQIKKKEIFYNLQEKEEIQKCISVDQIYKVFERC